VSPRSYPAALLRFADSVAGVALLASIAIVALRVTGTDVSDHARSTSILFIAIAAITACASIAYLAWNVHPATLLVAGLIFSVFTPLWKDALGIPGALAPQRLLMVAGIASFIVRAPSVAGRPRIRMRPVHWVLLIASVYGLLSALEARTLTDNSQFFRLLEAYGLLPFAIFVIAPIVFADERHREMLLASLVGLGFYLGLTAIFEVAGPSSLILPHYIADPSVGIHFGRARGPFLEATTNGFGLYIGAVCATGAVVLWKSFPARLFAVLTALLCAAGLLFTLQRSVWLGAIVATIVVGLARPEIRRFFVPLLLAATVAASAAYAVVPSGKLHERATDSETVWARKNLNRAGLNVLEAHPLFGAGWGEFVPLTGRGRYFELAQDYPLAGVGNVLHNTFMSNAAELGLVGVTCWLAALLLGLWEGLRTRSRAPDGWFWKSALLAFAVFYVVVSNFIPTHQFPNTVFWLLAGVACATGHRRLTSS
jgi:putative inorganic carbon (hco3(-)) transporter